jgi:aminotransferase
MYTPAERMSHIPFSGVRSIFEKALGMERSGQAIIHLEIGRPDFDTPEHIKAAASAAIQEGKVHYTSNYGIPPLRSAIANKLTRDNNLNYSPDDEIIVTSGVSEGIIISTLGMLNPGDEVMILEPVFPAYAAAIRLAGAIPVPIPVSCEETYQPNLSDFETRLTSKTKMLVFCNPCNPTGVTLKPETLAKITDFAVWNNLLVISDEIYEKIVYHGQSITSIASLPGMRGRTITLNGFSKTYAMTGWRIGYLAADASIIRSLIRVHQNAVVCSTSFAQWGALAALESSQSCVAEMLTHYDRRRRLVTSELRQIPSLKFVEPDGAFYVYIDTRTIGRDAVDFSEELLENHRVAVVPWTRTHIRISFATQIETLQMAMTRIREAVASSNPKLTVSTSSNRENEPIQIDK